MSPFPGLSHITLFNNDWSSCSNSLILYLPYILFTPQNAIFSGKNRGLWYKCSFIFLSLCFYLAVSVVSLVCSLSCVLFLSFLQSLGKSIPYLFVFPGLTPCLAYSPTPFCFCKDAVSVWTCIFNHFLPSRDFQSSAAIIFGPSRHAYI